MQNAQALPTRDRSLEVTGRQARLQSSPLVTARRLAATLDKTSADADRAATGLRRRDPSAWSADASVQDAIAARLGRVR
jgi:hypothetical protein